MPEPAFQATSVLSDAQANFKKYIAFARDQLEVFGKDLVFDEVSWDLTDSLGPVGGHRRAVRFTKWNLGHQATWKVPMQEPVASFARAYIRNRWSQERTGALDSQLRALRALEEVCVAQGINSFAQITGETLAAALRLIDEKSKAAPAYTAGAELERIGAALSEHRLTLAPINFRSWLKDSDDATERVGAEFDARRMSKLPSPATLRAIGLLFGLAKEPGDRVVADTLAILSSAPDRVGEALILPSDCEVEEEHDGKLVYGLRWLNKKGAPPTVKWITGEMVPIVREAIGRLKAMSEKARKVATWYEENPSSLYVAPEHEELRGKEWLTRQEAEKLVWDGPVARTVLNNLLFGNGVPKEVRLDSKGGKAIYVRFADLERLIISKLPLGFPVFDRDYNLRFSDALYVFCSDALHGNKTPWRSMVTRLTHSQINVRIQNGKNLKSKSVFERFDLREEDGSPIKFNTHMLRHYLNTMAQHAGLNQLDIALWSGRKVVAQNEAYDHVSTDRKLEQIRSLGSRPFEVATSNGSQQLSVRAPISFEDVARLQRSAFHMTEVGACSHDYAMSPCMVHRDCLNCEEMYCVKGDAVRCERVRALRDNTRQALARAESAHVDGAYGASRWVVHQRTTLEHLDRLVELLDDQSIPSGAIIHVSTGTWTLDAPRRVLSHSPTSSDQLE